MTCGPAVLVWLAASLVGLVIGLPVGLWATRRCWHKLDRKYPRCPVAVLPWADLRDRFAATLGCTGTNRSTPPAVWRTSAST